ncbi:hypothetical protein J4227_01415 [Candidatus Woesearchaeota archaeon]|nr:hypothetical protein [Candidatus Woesearchaeota archaeon]
MPEDEKRRSIFDETPDEEKKRRKKILVDVVIVSLIALLATIMVLREGETIFEVQCRNCSASSDCEGVCLGGCLKKAYDSVTSAAYTIGSQQFCDCRCDHYLHSKFLGERCDEGYTKFGDFCCTDLNLDGICDRYNTFTTQMLELAKKTQSLSSCQSECNDNNKCTEDVCSPETDYVCAHQPIVPCCGNDICEQGEKCGACFTDCGSCITPESLKAIVEIVYGQGEWTEEFDLRSQVTSIYFENGIVQMAKINNPAAILRNYQEFAAFHFFPRPKEGILPAGTWEVTLEEEDYQTSRGRINEKVGYWKTSENEGVIFHNFNIYCSEDLYLRLSPEWAVKNNYFYSERYASLSAVNQFRTDIDDILPRAVEIVDKCPLGTSVSCKDCSHRLAVEEFINKVMGKRIIFMREDKNTYSSFGTQDIRLVITNQTNLTLMESADLVGFMRLNEANDSQWIKRNIDELEKSIQAKPEFRPGVTKELFYGSHNVSKNEIYKLPYENQTGDVVESGYGVIYDYQIRNEVINVDGTSMGYTNQAKDLLLSVQRNVVPCGNIYIELVERKSKTYDKALNSNEVANLKNDLAGFQVDLHETALMIRKECDDLLSSRQDIAQISG